MTKESLPAKTLLRMARQSDVADVGGCELLIDLLMTGRVVRNELQRFFAAEGMSDARFCALVVLHALDPEPSTPADLAHHTGVTRSAITDVLDQLENRRWIARHRDRADRRMIYVRLTRSGREQVEHLVPRFLQFITPLASDVRPAERTAIAEACEKIQRRMHPPRG